MKLTKEQVRTLAWAALFTEANLEGYGSDGDHLMIGSNYSSCAGFIKNDKERFIQAPNGKRLAGGMTPTTEFLVAFTKRLRNLGFTVTK
jgi:hypothetical protein